MSLVVGANPPLVTPYCERCGMPAERFQMDVVKSPYYVGLHVQCCGYTSSCRVGIDEVFRLHRTGEKLFAITRKGGYQGLRSVARR